VQGNNRDADYIASFEKEGNRNMKKNSITKYCLEITTKLITVSFLIFSIDVYAVEPYPIVGKTFFVVLMSDKTCNEVNFGADQKFQLQSANSGIVNGTYEYKGGQLTMRTADVPIFKKVRFQKFQESDGKLAVVMEDLIEQGVVNIYANQEFCKAANMRIINLQKGSLNKEGATKKTSSSGWVYSYTTKISGDDVKKEVGESCQQTDQSSFDSWWKKAKSDFAKQNYDCIQPGKAPSGEYFGNNFGCNLSKNLQGKVISMAEAVRSRGAVVNMWMGHWFASIDECEKARKNEPPK
jgi:hypothetical protein